MLDTETDAVGEGGLIEEWEVCYCHPTRNDYKTAVKICNEDWSFNHEAKLSITELPPENNCVMMLLMP